MNENSFKRALESTYKISARRWKRKREEEKIWIPSQCHLPWWSTSTDPELREGQSRKRWHLPECLTVEILSSLKKKNLRIWVNFNFFISILTSHSLYNQAQTCLVTALFSMIQGGFMPPTHHCNSPCFVSRSQVKSDSVFVLHSVVSNSLQPHGL